MLKEHEDFQNLKESGPMAVIHPELAFACEMNDQLQFVSSRKGKKNFGGNLDFNKLLLVKISNAEHCSSASN